MVCQQISVVVDYAKAGAVHNGFQPVLQAYVIERGPEFNVLQKRPAVILCPGGGYGFTSDREAEPVALRLVSAGINAFVLRYSVAPARYPCALLELARAVELVRQNAEKWHIDRNRVIVCGFSAGGHLAANLGVAWEQPFLCETLGAKSRDLRPNGMILSYPVITAGEYAHIGSFENLLGDTKNEELMASVSLEKLVNRSTPPSFLWHTQADPVVPLENTVLFAMALRNNKVPFELHIYERGGHGLSLADETSAVLPRHIVPDVTNWIEMAIKWLKRL